jgi:peptide/nickel transport system ATP-binding protein
VADLLAEPLLGAGQDQAGIDRRIEHLLERCGLASSEAGRCLGELSGGQRQRIGIAQALARQPELLVCDDAVSALDSAVKGQIVALLAELRQDYQLTFLFLGHDLGPVHHLCDRIGVLYCGRLVEIGSAEALLRAPRHPYSQAWLGVGAADDEDDAGLGVAPRDMADRTKPPSGCLYHPNCPFADAACRNAVPAMQTLAQGHAVACLHVAS